MNANGNGVYHELVATRYGPMLVNKHDAFVGRSLMKYGEFSKGEADLFRYLVQPDWTVLECGANYGAHTVLLAKLVGEKGRVIAFEPQRLVFHALCANIALQCMTQVWPYWAAVGNRTGTIRVTRLDPNADNNFGGLAMGDQHGAATEPVALLRLDSFATLPRVDFIKIDVEGMEADVLDGGRELLAKHRPVLYVENDREEKSDGLLALLAELGYETWRHEPPLFAADNYRGDAENLWPNIVSKNLICVPTERVGDYVRLRAAE